MNKTPNYQLNQWEADDRVQRIDFNADNAKIDAAIKAVDTKANNLSSSKANQSALNSLKTKVEQIDDRRVQLLKTGVPLAEEALTYKIDFQGVDPGEWKTLYLIIEIKTGRVNIGSSVGRKNASLNAGRSMLVFWPFFNPNTRGYGIFLQGETAYVPFCNGTKLADLSLVLYAGSEGKEYLSPGATYEIWGEK